MEHDAGNPSGRVLISELRGQIGGLWPVMLLVYTGVALAFAIVIVVRLRTGISIAEFTRDPLAFTGIPVYKGALSNLGTIVWSAGAAVCFFAYGLVRSREVDGAGSRFLLAGGLVTAWLLLDDLYMLHEVVFPEHLGVPQVAVYAVHISVLLWFVVWFRAMILRTQFLLLALALAGFGASVAVDNIAAVISVPGVYVLEDGAKLFGIVFWAAYFALVSAQHIQVAFDRPGA